MRNEAQLNASRPGIWLFSPMYPGLQQSLDKTKRMKQDIGAAIPNCVDSDPCISVFYNGHLYLMGQK